MNTLKNLIFIWLLLDKFATQEQLNQLKAQIEAAAKKQLQ